MLNLWPVGLSTGAIRECPLDASCLSDLISEAVASFIIVQPKYGVR